MPYFTYNQKNVYYKETGEGTPLLLLHGNTASSNMFGAIPDAYLPDYKVVVIDFLGHGQSDRLESFPTDLWFDEACQVITLIREKGWENVCLIGSSGGAQVAVNVALEAPELVKKVIADSFEGEFTLKSFTQNVAEDRAQSKLDPGARMFYQSMHGEDWESVVDNDTRAIEAHDRTIGRFFHTPLENLVPQILFTGSKEDEFISAVAPDYFETVYNGMINKIGHGRIYLFPTGGHPAMLSNAEEFVQLSKTFFKD